MNADNLQEVDPMMVRKFTPKIGITPFGGVVVIREYDVEDVGIAEKRLDYDEDVVDCSNRIFEITTAIIMSSKSTDSLTVFPSRRWRNHRRGDIITMEDRDQVNPRIMKDGEPFYILYIGNPIRILRDPEITVIRSPEFIIKSGIELGF